MDQSHKRQIYRGNLTIKEEFLEGHRIILVYKHVCICIYRYKLIYNGVYITVCVCHKS